MPAETSKVGKRGAVVIPASLRRRFGITEGSLVIAEERAEGVLIRPAAAFPLEMYTPERPQGELAILAKLPDNDRPIRWAAISVRATHLLSGDFKAFGRFYGQTINGVTIMPPAAYSRTFCRLWSRRGKTASFLTALGDHPVQYSSSGLVGLSPNH